MDTPARPTDGQSTGSSPRYLPQLDGIRALAILSVLLSHFLPVFYLPNRLIHFGRLGVVMFFVLSGFLITGILLRHRDQCLSRAITRGDYFRVFYVRRILRIFPIYYLVIAAGISTGFGPIREYWLWHVTYLSNFAAGFLGIRFGPAVHLWSLCVEEQFYLLWPLLVLFVPKRVLPGLALLIGGGSIAFKLIGSLAGLDWRATSYTTLGCLDSLSLGAILAMLRHERAGWVKAYATASLLLGLPLAVALQGFRFGQPGDVRDYFLYQGLVDVAFALLSVWLVNFAVRGSTGRLGRVLQSRPLVYVGKISYGIYLYHLFVRVVSKRLLQQIGMPVPEAGYGSFFFYAAMTIAVAAVSWRFLEKPINDLKQRFAPSG